MEQTQESLSVYRGPKVDGEKLAEGKTKIIFAIPNDPHHVRIVSKTQITAGNGLKKDNLEGKDQLSNQTTCNCFRVISAVGIPTHYIYQDSPNSFKAKKCGMIPLEVIVRRVAAGSLLKRFPEFKQGHRFEAPRLEFTFKDDVLGDPEISEQEILQKKMMIEGLLIDQKCIDLIKDLAIKAFLVLEKAWQSLNVVLVDYKVEFGVTTSKEIILADVIDNDSWRIWPNGDPNQMKDKQIYRNFPNLQLTKEQKELLIASYKWVANNSSMFFEPEIISAKNSSETSVLVVIAMGSQSDWEVMKEAADVLNLLQVPFEARIISAHRTPERMVEFAKTAESKGIKVIIAGAGGSAHLPGMISSLTTLPVLGVPVSSSFLNGLDSLLSIVQMPGGVPVGTLAVGKAGAKNAGLLAASILSSSGNHPVIAKNYAQFRKQQTDSVAEFPSSPSSQLQSSTVMSTIIESSTEQPSKAILENVLNPGSVIGIVGGGQLAKMTCLASANLGYKTCIYSDDKASPAFQVASSHFVGNYDDQDALQKFAKICDVITYEFENIPEETLIFLNNLKSVYPKPRVNGICQHRIMEKDFINSLQLKTAKYKKVSSLNELSLAIEEIGTPCILKTVGGGYDGKGQYKINKPSESGVAFESLQKFRKGDCILESFVSFTKEVSVIVCRDKQGHIETFPVAENSHSNHVLHQSVIPASIPDQTAREARDAAIKIAKSIDLVGVLAVEMFIVETKNNTQVYINELAPRPHNSGHWTIEGAETSQFSQLVRAVAGIPLGSTCPIAQKIVMQNLLGDEILEWKSLVQQPKTYVHIYGKTEIKPGRKMGHFTKLG